MRHNTIIGFVLLPILSLSLASCNESEFLKEEALSFYTPSNSYVTESDFMSAVTTLYSQVRNNLWGTTYGGSPYFVSTDIAKDGRFQLNSTRFGGHTVYCVPTNSVMKSTWDNWYKLVSNANSIIDRAEGASMSNASKKRFVAEAKFFRAFGYRFLVYLYGGVPLVLNEVTSPKTDYVRASKQEVLNQMADDLQEACAGLPDISSVEEGRVSNLVAYHLLAETYISLGEYQKAIDAATVVINDPNTAIMTDRFGCMANQNPTDPDLKFTQEGDVFWDMYRAGNQSRSSGNKESLWVCQFEVDTNGGLLASAGGWTINGQGANLLERTAGPAYWGLYLDPDGKPGTLGFSQSTYMSGGAGVSLMMNTDWWLNDLWESDWDNDIRNAPHNIVRDVVYNNPSSAYYGKSALEYVSPTQVAQPWRWYPFPSKITTPGQHPDDLFTDKSLLALKGTAGSTYRDQYIFRLAETYLLRAEAYLDAGNAQKAAEDVNVVRERSKANPVAASDVTLDYILDERAREFVYEEPRRIILTRVGKLVERVRKYNELNSSEIQDYHELWPIPQSFIDANVSVTIEQNPGY
ncbi:MAG: RagB/SusD family nutrient uptake outer membrane protein [Bacteroidales bacterium]|nr:RagB/SusD family nutrient uptake outer membrane protein [Bacteroidales bacterium]